jgi:two-component system response regulator RpaA
MVNVMIVDDDVEVLGTLERLLGRDGFEVIGIDRGLKAIEYLDKNTLPDLLILDVDMPGMTGIEVCRHLRGDSRFITLPILFLTALGAVDHVVEGLDAGADDYVIKPFELPELRARVHALLRRSTRVKDAGNVLVIGNMRLDSDTYQVTVADKVIQLTSTEHRLLRYLMENANQAQSLSHLLQAVWEYPLDTGDPDLVRAHVRNLRAKIEVDSDRRYIRTIHGVGYMIPS